MTKKVMMVDISKSIDEYTLSRLYTLDNLKNLSLTIKEKLNLEFSFTRLTRTTAIEFLIENWNYKIACSWTRSELSKKDSENVYIYPKYQSMVDSSEQYKVDINNWYREFNGDPKWVISQGSFDSFVQKTNRNDSLTYDQKNESVSRAAISMRLLTAMNTSRNDLIEYMMINKYENIMPTIKHIAGIDYYIDGVGYDQKVSRSLGAAFKKEHPENTLEYATNHPDEVAKSLFENQDSGRFKITATNRLFVIFTSEETTLMNIKLSILRSNLNEPYKVKANYELNDINNEIDFNSFVIFVN